jgi:predicted regulator of Ras-like GTPase activity (Roadblock/LC7/MglB family)
MALQGTLADLGIVDLVQFPYAGRKTGELVITSQGRTAQLYYVDGAVVHAEMGGMEGMEAIVSVVDLNEGEFEFRQDVSTDRRTIELDLHRVVMLALKTRDEKRLEAQQHGVRDEPEGKMERLLRDFVHETPVAEHVSVLAFNGEVTAQAARDGVDNDGLDELFVVLHDLRRNFPRAGLSRMLVEDELGTVGAVQLGDGRVVVLIAGRQSPMGAISVALKKLGEKVQGAG